MSVDITVIVPIYNVEKYVAKCLDSLLKQTYQDFIVLAVNDGSPDNSAKIVEQYEKRDPRIKLINKKNGGYGSVLEYGIKNIKTKYFLICDPDDWLPENTLFELHKFAESNNLDMVIGDKYEVYPADKKDTFIKKYVETFDKSLNILPKKVYSQKDIQKFAFGAVSPHAKLFKTSVAQGINFPHKVSYTDFVLYMMALSNSKRVAYYNKPLAFYLIDRPGNTKTDVRKSIISDYDKVWNSVFKQLTDQKKDSSIFMYRMYVQIEYMLYEYARVSNASFKDKYGKLILNDLDKLKKYKVSIDHIIKSPKKKILFIGLIHNSTRIYVAKLYCNLKKRG